MTDVILRNVARRVRESLAYGREYPAANMAMVIMALYLSYRLAANYIVNQFYVSGSQVDTYLYSTLFWHCDLMQNIPGNYVRGSYLRLHFSFFSLIPCAVSHILPVERIAYLGSVMGTLHAFLGSVMMLLLHLLWPQRSAGAVFLKALAGFAFSLNICAQAVLSQAHVELAAPPLLLLFLLALVLRKHVAAGLALILAFSVREDVGFHLFGLMFLVLAVDWVRGLRGREQATWAIYALIAFAYSVFAFTMMRYAIKDYGNLTNVYLGSNWFSHLTYEKMAGRLTLYLNERSWIWISWLVAGAWAVVARNPYIVLGYAAFIPWILLSFIAKSSAAGNLSMHYGYPFLLAGAWPFIAIMPEFANMRGIKARNATLVPVVFAFALLLSQQLSINLYRQTVTLGFYKKFFVDVFPPQGSLLAKPALDDLERRLMVSKAELRRIRVDSPVKALAPYAFDDMSYHVDIGKLENKRKKDPESFEVPRDIDAIMAYEYLLNRPVFRQVAALNNLTYRYWLPGTKVRLFTNFDLSEAPTFHQIFLPLEERKVEEKAKEKVKTKAPLASTSQELFYWEEKKR